AGCVCVPGTAAAPSSEKVTSAAVEPAKKLVEIRDSPLRTSSRDTVSVAIGPGPSPALSSSCHRLASAAHSRQVGLLIPVRNCLSCGSPRAVSYSDRSAPSNSKVSTPGSAASEVYEYGTPSSLSSPEYQEPDTAPATTWSWVSSRTPASAHSAR